MLLYTYTCVSYSSKTDTDTHITNMHRMKPHPLALANTEAPVMPPQAPPADEPRKLSGNPEGKKDIYALSFLKT